MVSCTYVRIYGNNIIIYLVKFFDDDCDFDNTLKLNFYEIKIALYKTCKALHVMVVKLLSILTIYPVLCTLIYNRFSSVYGLRSYYSYP